MNQGRMYALANIVAGTKGLIVSPDAWDWLKAEGVITNSGEVNRDALSRLVEREFGETEWSKCARGAADA